MFYSIPAGFKSVTINLTTTPKDVALMMTPVPKGSTSTWGQKYDEKSLFDVRPGDAYYCTEAQADAAKEHFQLMLDASGCTAETYNPVIACIVGGYFPSAVMKLWNPNVADYGAFTSKVQNAYCSAVHSLQKRPGQPIPIEILIPVEKEAPSRKTWFDINTLNAFLKGE